MEKDGSFGLLKSRMSPVQSPDSLLLTTHSSLFLLRHEPHRFQVNQRAVQRTLGTNDQFVLAGGQFKSSERFLPVRVPVSGSGHLARDAGAGRFDGDGLAGRAVFASIVQRD